ncbi:MAG: carboxypeptidase regulatory-like domain-containing protein [Deltaproteobacteria bacterium]|nr:carboxypeptidase regulatory-like domain-containing protein [Deltaproteobacteria bacterium]
MAPHRPLLLLVGACALAALLLPTACEEPRLGSFTLQLRTPPSPWPRCAKGPASLGRVEARGEPIAGATVVLKPSGLSATSDARGLVRLANVPHGRYSVEISAPGYRPMPAPSVEVAGDKSSELTLYPCISAGANQLRVGFARPVTLEARSLCDASWEEAALTWRQLEGPNVSASVKNFGAKRLTFTTRPLEELRPLPDQPQILSFSHDQAGEYLFEVQAVSRTGLRSRAQVLVTSTDVTSGVTSVPPFARYHFVGPKEGPWSWTVVKQPEDWQVNLEGATTRVPSVRPVPPASAVLQQTIAIRDEKSHLTFAIVVGGWNVVRRDCGRPECHAAMEGHWKQTHHAQSWQRFLDGALPLARGPAGDACAECHSLGYDADAPSGGYDDLAALHKVSVPAKLQPGNYAALPEPVKEVSNVYCLACHGPARVDPPVAEQPGLFQVGVCARCHERKPELDVVAQWRLSKHAKTITGQLNGPENREPCARCHTAQGFYYAHFALSRPPSRGTAVLACCENPAPIGCQGCHNAMLAHNKAQLHRADAVQTESGLALAGVGGAALCATCHHAGHDVRTRAALDGRLAPHAPQADLGYGRAGFLLPAPAEFPPLEGTACVKAAKNGCVTCHMDPGPGPGLPGHKQLGGHTFRMRTKEGLMNVRPCQACHAGMASFDPLATGDYDGDGTKEGIRTEVDGLLALLKERLSSAIAARGYRGCDRGRTRGAWIAAGTREKLVVVDAGGADLGDCDRSGALEREEEPHVFPLADELLHKAAYNYLLVARDGSRGQHNLPYAVKLLQRTIHAVTEGRDVPAWELRR